jgi:phosphopantothenoylcysteine decarboxylase / phosphopantothenate---cysteine ligase
MITSLEGKQIILGVCGGIAAYKSIELLRLIVKQGADVRVIMTRNAQAFVGPLTFQALSRNSVCTSLFENSGDASIRHIDWAEKADAVVIAPATANMVAKLANGMADDALSTFMLAITCRKIVCPSMNTHMYESRPHQRNLEILRQDGYVVLEPGAGELACGTTGPGRLPEPEVIFNRLLNCFSPKDFEGKRVVVTAGPTREPIDPVRFISNPSTGKMGFAVAEAAEHRGAAVTLITGPTHLPDPINVNTVRVETALDMEAAVFQYLDDAHVIIKTAAVSDFRSTETAAQKIKKGDSGLTITLDKNPDILKEVGRRKKNQFLVGFAAETEDLEQNAGKKLAEKNLELIVGNLVDHPDFGFGSDNNKVTFFFRDGTKESLPAMTKEAVAHTLLDRILLHDGQL